MRVPTKYLFYDGLPNAKDKDKILADNGYASLPQVDQRNYQPIDINSVQASVGDPYMNNGSSQTGSAYDNKWEAAPGNGINNFAEYRKTLSPELQNELTQADERNAVSYNNNAVSGSLNSAYKPQPLNLDFKKPDIKHNPNGLGEYVSAGLGIADSLIPGERIHKNYVTQPQPVYNAYKYGTGSQAIMEQGGDVTGNMYGRIAAPGTRYIDDLTENAKSGWLSGAVNPKHVGFCSPMTKSTCTPRRKAFAERAKHHNLDDGGEVSLYNYDEMDNAENGLGFEQLPLYQNPNIQSIFKHNFNLQGTNTTRGMVNDEMGNDFYAGFRDPNGNATNDPQKWIDARNASSPTEQPTTGAKSGIHIKPSEKGSLHKHLKIPLDKKIPASMLKDKTGDSEAIKKKKNFARNARKWAANGADIPFSEYDAIAFANNEIMLESYDKRSVRNGGELPNYAPGGDLSSSKAAEILHDGTANGHPITDKQRRFFGWKSNQKAPAGTSLPLPPPGMQQTGTLPATPQSRTDAYLLDDINQTLASGVRTKNTGYAPDQQKLLNDAYIWRAASSRKGPQENIQGYFDQPVDTNNPMHMMRARLSKIGGGPMGMYNSTPNADVRNAVPPQTQPSFAVNATMENGGFVEGSVHDLPEETIAKLLKSGLKFEHFKD